MEIGKTRPPLYGVDGGLARDTFFIRVNMKLVECASGKTAWKFQSRTPVSLEGKKLSDVKKDQEALKEGLDRVIDRLSHDVRSGLDPLNTR
jgi:hypothetical protein